MNLAQAMTKLESLGSEQTRKTYLRHGAKAPLFGVKFGDLKVLAKQIKKDHALATALWKTGNHDARHLAAMIADPAAFGPEAIESWLDGLDQHGLIDALAGVVAQGPHAREKAEAWSAVDDEWRARAGFRVIAGLALHDASLPDSFFEIYIAAIEKRIHAAPNRAREAMNTALIAIGGRNEALQTKAIAAARAIGKIEVDHGDTDCKTPDAEAYILKMTAHRAGKKAAAKAAPVKKVAAAPARKAAPKGAARRA